MTAKKHFDYDIFNENANNTVCKDITTCHGLKRLFIALKYRDLICNKSKSMFVQFNTEIYKNFLNDYIHLIVDHNNDLNKIHNQLTQQWEYICHAKISCPTLKRHYEPFSRVNNEYDEKYEFFAAIYDQIHHFVLHLYAIGLRIFTDQNEEKSQQNNIEYDLSFKQKIKLVQAKKNSFQISRYTNENNKYNIQQVINIESTNNRNETVLDFVYKNIELDPDIKHKNDVLNKLKHYINENEYDTDSISADLFTNNNQREPISNLSNHINYSFCIEKISNYVLWSALSNASFSSGFLFFYWGSQKDYKTEREIGDRLNGFSEAELFVSPCYPCLKQEVLQSNFININQWNVHIIEKLNIYYDTEKAKNMKCTDDKNMHGIKKESQISKGHLCAVILYCDWSELCKKFSATFRKMRSYDTLSAVKEKNREYANWSRLLRETVESFGDNAVGQPNGDKTINV
eukprot:477208_1